MPKIKRFLKPMQSALWTSFMAVASAVAVIFVQSHITATSMFELKKSLATLGVTTAVWGVVWIIARAMRFQEEYLELYSRSQKAGIVYLSSQNTPEQRKDFENTILRYAEGAKNIRLRLSTGSFAIIDKITTNQLNHDFPSPGFLMPRISQANRICVILHDETSDSARIRGARLAAGQQSRDEFTTWSSDHYCK